MKFTAILLSTHTPRGSTEQENGVRSLSASTGKLMWRELATSLVPHFSSFVKWKTWTLAFLDLLELFRGPQLHPQCPGMASGRKE